MKNLMMKRSSLLREFEQCAEFVRGSVNSVCAKCGRARCVCEKKIFKKAYRLTYKDGQQKTRIVYVPQRALPRIKKMIDNYSRVRQIMEQIIEINIKIFKQSSDR